MRQAGAAFGRRICTAIERTCTTGVRARTTLGQKRPAPLRGAGIAIEKIAVSAYRI